MSIPDSKSVPASTPVVFTIKEFYKRNHISKTTYYQLKNRGEGPREMQLGRAIRISAKAEAEWQAARENSKEKRNAQRAASRVRQAKKAGKLSAASANHVSKKPRAKK